MKKIIYLFAFLCSVNLLLAQAPQSMNYQGVARKASGEPLLGKAIKIRFSVVDATPTILYSETHSVTTNQQTGIFSLSIGAGTPVTGTFAAIDWTSGSRSLKIEMDENGGNNFTLIGTNPFQTVPYALYAEKTKVPDIALFEERLPWGQSPPSTSSNWNRRKLNFETKASPYGSITLNVADNTFKFNQIGTYLITASAPSFKGKEHRVCIKNITLNNIEIFGSGAYVGDVSNINMQSNSNISALLNVTSTTTIYCLEHYIANLHALCLGVSMALPAPNNSSHETYSTIMIQKISN